MAPFNLSGKYAVLTGGGSGITLEFIKLLLARGTSVIVGDLALRPEAEELAAEYPHPPESPKKVSFIFHKTDVTSWPQLSSLWTTALSQFPQVDLVVPGAGILEPDRSSFWNSPGVEGSPSTDDRDAEPGTYATINVNLAHPIRLAQLALAYWTTGKIQGNLLFLGSVAGYAATVNFPLYHSTKAGLHGFVNSLAPLRARLGIRVACVAPGPARTPIWDSGASTAKLSNTDPSVTAASVAEVMLGVCTSDKYGDGNIVEFIEAGTVEKPDPRVREVPYHLLYPRTKDSRISSIAAEEERMWKRLESTGFKA